MSMHEAMNTMKRGRLEDWAASEILSRALDSRFAHKHKPDWSAPRCAMHASHPAISLSRASYNHSTSRKTSVGVK